MEEIKLTDLQSQVLTKQLNGTFSPFLATEQEQEAMAQVIEMADKLMHEQQAYNEAGDNTLLWFAGKIKHAVRG